MTAFHEKVAQCKHDGLTEYYHRGGCGTDYCSGWVEAHCWTCRVYIVECPCGACNRMSGWPNSRWHDWRRKKYG